MENTNEHGSDHLSEQTLYIKGMHCSSCEILIEKKLLKRDGIESVDASLKDGEVRIVKKGAKKFKPYELDEMFSSLGYTFSTTPVEKTAVSLFVTDKSGNRKISPVQAKKLFKSLFFVGGLIAAFFVVEDLQLGKFVSINSGSALSAFFSLGLVAGISSCAALIGGLLLSLIKHWHEQYIDAETTIQRANPHVLFHAGRFTSFFVLGGVLGTLGDAVTLNNTTLYVSLVIGVSLIMALLALQMLNISWAARFTPRLPKFITRVAAKDGANQSKLMPFVTGALTFFLPCGFTLIAQGVALASGSFFTGAMVMLYFAFGTFPMLMAISIGGLKFTSRPHLTARFSHIAGMLILFFALYNINGQFNVLGLPSLSDVSFAKTRVNLNTPSTSPSSGTVNGEQILSIIAKDFSYIPTSATILKAGVPTKLIVDDQGVLGCGSFIASRGLFEGFVPLQLGQNIIDLGSPRPGTYKLTCSMGMVPPVTITVK